jgi:uncharacterized protein
MTQPLGRSTTSRKPRLSRPDNGTYAFRGELGRRLAAVTGQWLLPVAHANPRILEMFRERDLEPYANQMPWAGEFAGKHLTCATQILRLTGDRKLRESLDWFVGELVALQAEDGYLGPWPREYRLRKGGPSCTEPWDAWGHYHIMLGLLFWHELHPDRRAFDCARRIGDLLVRRFLHGTEKLHDTGAHEMNQAPVHSLLILYRLTGEADYLALSKKIVEEFALPPAGDYYRQGLAEVPFHQTPKPRWESLHPIMGLVELYYVTGDESYRRAFENLWWSMLEGDRHNNGGFTSGEKATGSPYHRGAIETCCTVAWTAMTVEMLKLTGNPVVADELELTLLNSGFGMMSPSGRWVTYNTPMEGTREASAHSIVFQARAGSAELNCCSVNGPRILGLVGEWALLTGKPGELFLNYYGAGTLAAALPSGQTLRLTQKTNYPRTGTVKIMIGLDHAERFILALRVPAWSEETKVTVRGEAPAEVSPGAPRPGEYLRLDRVFQPGDVIEVELDMRPHAWAIPTRYLSLPPWVSDWTVYGPIPRRAGESTPPEPALTPPLETLLGAPEAIVANGVSFPGRPMHSAAGVLHIDDRQAPTVIAVTEWQSDTDGRIRINFDADYWTQWWVNGQEVYSTMRGGNRAPCEAASALSLLPHGFVAPIRRGRNVVVLRLVGGIGYGTSACRIMMEAAELEPGREESEATMRLSSIYRGPVLLACDAALNDGDGGLRSGLDFDSLTLRPAATERTWLAPQLLLATNTLDAKEVRLCDFASAGLSGSRYRTWLPLRFASPPSDEFVRSNPLRTRR